jgi:hypothetical protein
VEILAGLKDKLRFIIRFCDTPSDPFRETRREIESHEIPFEPLPFDPETATDFAPAFSGYPRNLFPKDYLTSGSRQSAVVVHRD